MSEQTFDRQAVTQYLLGAVPEAEAERFDELSLTDDEFADTVRVAEKDLVDGYVQGELSGAALEWFESYYLASPLRREKVQFAQAFQVFADRNAGTKAAQVKTESQTKRKGSGWFSSLSMLTSPRLAWGFAVATLALLIAGGLLVFQNIRLRQQVSQMSVQGDAPGPREEESRKLIEGQRTANEAAEQERARLREERARAEQAPAKQQAQNRAGEQQRGAGQRQLSPANGLSIATFILAPQVRGAGQVPAVSIPAKTDYIAMQLKLEPNDYPMYRVVLSDQANNQILWRSGKLSARATEAGKTLSVRFRAGLLMRQSYVLRVSGVAANGAAESISDYAFTVVK